MKLVVLLLCLTCCITTERIGERIIGGSHANAGQFPFMAAIYKITATGNYFCSGTLVSNRHVVTSAQCVYNATSFQVRLGSHYLQTADSNRVILSTPIYYYHDDYDPNTLEYDVGIIEFLMPITRSDYIRPVHIMGGPLVDNTPFVTVGWGQTSDSDAGLSETLNFVSVTAITNNECKITYGNQIGNYTVCTIGNYNEGTCTGDTGSPLIWYTEPPESIEFFVGIASFVSFNGCESTHPSGFIRISYVFPWISQFL